MDWKLVLSTFTAMILAELGDKTQLTVLTLTASSNRPLSVFTGASVALVGSTLLGVLVGTPFSQVVPITYLRSAGGLAFIAIGVAMVLGWL